MELTQTYTAEITVVYKQFKTKESMDEAESILRQLSCDELERELRLSLSADDVKVTNVKLFRNDKLVDNV